MAGEPERNSLVRRTQQTARELLQERERRDRFAHQAGAVTREGAELTLMPDPESADSPQIHDHPDKAA